MWRNKFFSKISYIVIIILGLVPLLWYRVGSVAAGHDMGYSFTPFERILSRLYIWSDSFNFGQDGSWNIGSIPLYIPEAILDWVGLGERSAQMIVFVFWFLMPGLAMLYLLKTIAQIIRISKNRELPFVLFGSVFYMFNHYLLQGWFVAAKSEFCLVIATPIIIAFLLKIIFLEENPVLYGLIGALLFTFFNATGATGVALFGGFIVVLVWFFIYFIILRFLKLPKLINKNSLIFIVVLISAFFALNAYWIFPFAYYTLQSYSDQLTGTGGTAGVINWIDSVSKHATFANLFRLQGFAGWYEIENHPYSSAYIKNPILIAISFIFPALIIYSLYLLKKVDRLTQMMMGFFFGLILVTLFFMSGTRTPLGIVYENFVKYVPGFAIFRSPFYKFGYVLWIAYAVLITFSLSHIFSIFSNKIKSARNKYFFFLISISLSLVIFLAYSFPFLTGSFFIWDKPLSTMVTPPSEIFEFKDWMKTHSTGKVLLYPPLSGQNSEDSYSWNYWSLTPFPNLLSEKGIVSNNGFLSSRQKTMIEQLYFAIEQDDKEKVLRLVKLLNISHILFRRDEKTDLSWFPMETTIDKYEAIIKTASWLKLEESFGDWYLYSVTFADQGKEFISIKNSESVITRLDYLDNIISLIPNNSMYFLDEDLTSAELVSLHERFIASQCVNCNLVGEADNFSAPDVTFLPSSIFYQYLLFKEKTRLSRAKTSEEKAVLLSDNAARRILELQKIIRGKDNRDLSSEELTLMVKIIDEVNKQLSQIMSFREKSLQTEGLNNSNSLYMQSFTSFMKKEMQQLKYALPRRDDIDGELKEMNHNLSSIQEITNQKLWETVDEKEPHFVLQIPVDGQYSLSLIKEKNANYDDFFQGDFLKSGKIHIVSPSASMSAIGNIEDGYDFGKIYLSAGQHKIFLQLPFYKKIISLPEINIPSYGEPFIVSINGLVPNNFYQLDFDYRQESTHGISYKAVAKLENGKTIEIQMTRLTNNYLMHQKILLTTPATLNQIKEVTLTVEHSSLEALAFPIILDNITVRPLINPLILARQEKKSITGVQEENGTVQRYKKVNPVLYTAEIKNARGPFYLIFNEGFSKNWKAFIMRGKLNECNGFFCGISNAILILVKGEKISDRSHLQSYGFSNAWLIQNEKENFYVVFFYIPQMFAYTGFIITFIGAVIVSVSLILLKLKHKKS